MREMVLYGSKMIRLSLRADQSDLTAHYSDCSGYVPSDKTNLVYFLVGDNVQADLILCIWMCLHIMQWQGLITLQSTFDIWNTDISKCPLKKMEVYYIFHQAGTLCVSDPVQPSTTFMQAHWGMIFVHPSEHPPPKSGHVSCVRENPVSCSIHL